MKKRILSFFITICMVLTILPISVFADEINSLPKDAAASSGNVDDKTQKESSEFLPDDSTTTPLASSSVPNSSTSAPPDSISAPSSFVPKSDDDKKAENGALQAQLPSNKSSVIDEGTYGGCDWVIDKDYTLTISQTPSPAPGLSSGVLPSPAGGVPHNLPWSTYGTQILKVVINDGVKSGANLIEFLSGLTSCTTMDLSGLDTTAATDMYNMFYNCYVLKTITFGASFKTASVENMSYMFYDCIELQQLDLSGFDTAKVTDMSHMFEDCRKLVNLNLGNNFDTVAVTDMTNMFAYCMTLETLNLGGKFTTTNVKGMSSMFNYCEKLTALDLKSFDTSNVENMIGMFNGCTALKELDLSNFKTDNVDSMFAMFQNCTNLKTLDISGFTISDSTDIKKMLKGNTLILNTNCYKTAMNPGNTVITLYGKAGKDDLTTKDLIGTEANIKYMPQVITASLNDITLTGAMSDTDAKDFFDTAKVFNNGTSLYNNENGYAYPGAQVTVAVKDANKIIDTVTVVKTNDVSTTITVTNNTFTMPAFPVTINAVVKEKPTYLLTLADTGDNSYGGGKMNIGDTVKIYAGTKQGYRFIGWETTNGGILADTMSAETTFNLVNGPCTLIARWVAIEGHSGKKNPSTGVSAEMPSNALALALPLALVGTGALLIAKRRKHN